MKSSRATPSIAINMSSQNTTYIRSRELLARDDSRVLLVDVQGKLTAIMPGIELPIANCRKLLLGARILGVPVSATEQYPRGLGPTVPELAELVEMRVEKQRFSSAECLSWVTEDKGDRVKVVVIGIEAHVCIQQTALDAMANGFRVYIAVDAVGARFSIDHDTALRRLEASGATLTTTESALFEWCEVAGTPEFKQISALIKGAMVDGP